MHTWGTNSIQNRKQYSEVGVFATRAISLVRILQEKEFKLCSYCIYQPCTNLGYELYTMAVLRQRPSL